MQFHELWDSCAQNKASEISKNELSGILGLLCAEQNVGNLKHCTFRNSGTPVRRTKRRKSQRNGRSSILGLLCAEQDVGNRKKMHFQDFWDSCAKNKTSEISENRLSGIGDSCAQKKTSEISKNALSIILGLLCAEQNVINFKKCTFQNSGTPVRRTRRRKYHTMHV